MLRSKSREHRYETKIRIFLEEEGVEEVEWEEGAEEGQEWEEGAEEEEEEEEE